MKLGLISPSFPLMSKLMPELEALFPTEEGLREEASIAAFKHSVAAKIAYAHEYFGNFIGAALPLIAGLTPKSLDIKILDENKEEVDFEEGFDIVGITAMTQQATRAYEMADEFRKRGVFVVIGGIHATVLPGEAKEHADTVMVGEAENTWPQFIVDFLMGRPEPFYRERGVVDLTRSPVPRFDLLKDKGYRSVPVLVTRGCPHDCEFCASSKIYGVRYRHKTVEQIVTEIEAIKAIWENPFISFADDNLFLNKRFSKELLKALIPLNIRWSAFCDVSVADDEELLELIRESGGASLLIGFEGVTEEGLASFGEWKRRQLDRYPEAIKNIQAQGIVIRGTFIVGFDTDDVSIFERMERFLSDNHISLFNIGILTPFPGTRLRERLERENRLLDTPWSHYNFYDVNFIPKRMSPIELKRGMLEISRRLYEPENQMKQRAHLRKIYRDLYRSGRTVKTF